MSVRQSLGKVAVVPKGSWDGTKTYEFLDIVKYGGGSYIARKDVPIGTAITNTEYWVSLVDKGEIGDDGVSPSVTVTPITGGHRVTITDAEHPQGQSIDVMDGEVNNIDTTLSVSGAAADAKVTGDKIGDLKSAFVRETNATSHLNKNWKSDKNYYGIVRDYPLPDTAFNAFGVKIYSDKKRFFTDYKPEEHKNVGGNTIYYSPNGNNSNTGTKDNPKKYPTRPYAENVTHVFMDGVYTRSIIPEINKNINIVAENPGKVLFINGDDYTYTYSDGVYSTTRSNVCGVTLKKDDQYIPLRQVLSLATCKKITFTFFSDSSTVYLNVGDLIVPDNTNTFLNLNTGNPLFSIKSDVEDINVYFEGIDFIGGASGGIVISDTTDYTPTAHFYNCKFIGSWHGSSPRRDGLYLLGGIAYLNKCEACFAKKDGFGYHGNIRPPKSIEIDCISHDNGFQAADNTNNGSTCHEGGTAVRINCVYYNNVGANVADVHTGTKSLNLGCLAFNSNSSETGYNSDFSTQQPDATMWLDCCEGYGSDWSIFALSGTTIYVHDTESETTQGSGTIDQTWDPWA